LGFNCDSAIKLYALFFSERWNSLVKSVRFTGSETVFSSFKIRLDNFSYISASALGSLDSEIAFSKTSFLVAALAFWRNRAEIGVVRLIRIGCHPLFGLSYSNLSLFEARKDVALKAKCGQPVVSLFDCRDFGHKLDGRVAFRERVFNSGVHGDSCSNSDGRVFVQRD